jgi:rubrerythrin
MLAGTGLGLVGVGTGSGTIVELANRITQGNELTERLDALAAQQEDEQAHPDIDVLNYALTLEHLEYTFYREGLEKFSEEELMDAKLLDPFGETITMEVPKYLADIRENEEAHVDTISKTIEKLGGNPVPEGKYAFGYKTPSEFLKIAKALENTGVTAYKGAAPEIADNAVLKPALAVHSVEARHASFLNLINTTSPFPRSFDRARTVEEVLEIAMPFIKKQPELDKKAITKLDDKNDPKPDRKKDDKTSDLEVLKYALTLERLEATYYTEGLKELKDCELENAVMCRFGEEVTENVPKRLAAVRDHEQAHVKAIEKAIKQFGGEVPSSPEFKFPYSNANEFLKLAMAFENLGVSAYLGAAPTVSNNTAFKSAAAIQSVEARHAAYFNELNGKLPFPRAFDKALPMDKVLEMASKYIASS